MYSIMIAVMRKSSIAISPFKVVQWNIRRFGVVCVANQFTVLLDFMR